MTPSSRACSVVRSGSRSPTVTVTDRCPAGLSRTAATAVASSSSDTPRPTLDFTTLGTPLRILKVASRPEISIGLSCLRRARCRTAPSSWGTSSSPSTVKLSASPTASPGSTADTDSARTVMGDETASVAISTADAAASDDTDGSTLMTAALTGARGLSTASTSAADVASTSRARPGTPGVSTGSPSSTTRTGSTGATSRASEITCTWAARAASSTAATAGRESPPRKRSTRSLGFQVRP